MMIIAISVVGFVLLLLLVGRLRLGIQFRRDVNVLFAQSENMAGQTFHQSQLDKLPEPVQRYFNYTLKDGQPYISCARIKHIGQFKPGMDKAWISIKGEQYAIAEKPGFIWKGTTLWFTALDLYIGNKGRLLVKLLSWVNVIDGKGEKYDQGELLRWLGESVMYPTNFLPSERLHWLPVNSMTAKLTYSYNGLSLFFVITFNEIGEIVEMETKRYMDEHNLETWVIKVSDYKELNNVFIPTSFDVLWRLQKGDFSYARFRITEVDYNKLEMFYWIPYFD